MRVHINAGGREVELATETDANISLRDVTAEALALWRSLDPPAGGVGPAFGVQAELSQDRPATTAGFTMGIVE